ncbi:Uncharacterised protein [Legionella quateirensis]|uniref:Uncharacterized protein n=1 Tax=Legionella quateirensis TaxID=45072 RepID=A0A378KY42_9GAMM|nr:hypothetical protein Lqua_0505 [Legionella quateirensis]STY19089.1 Uncharacterised protein [Legionella quateirensis]
MNTARRGQGLNYEFIDSHNSSPAPTNESLIDHIDDRRYNYCLEEIQNRLKCFLGQYEKVIRSSNKYSHK